MSPGSPKVAVHAKIPEKDLLSVGQLELIAPLVQTTSLKLPKLVSTRVIASPKA